MNPQMTVKLKTKARGYPSETLWKKMPVTAALPTAVAMRCPVCMMPKAVPPVDTGTSRSVSA